MRCESRATRTRTATCTPSPDLEALQHFGITFTILEGCWSSGAAPAQDFTFPGAPKNEETGEEATGFYQKDMACNGKGVPYYSKWVGACNRVSLYKTFWMKCEREYADTLAAHMPEGSRVRYYENGAAHIEFPRTAAPHLSQITAFINCY